MVKGKPTRWIRELVLDGLTEPSPFEKVGSQSFLKYDKITVEINGGKLEVSFFWNNKAIFAFTPEYTPGMVFSIDGVEGRMAINL